ncbi:MAG: SDR family oxidoreductase [Deltaproteobacteria bacterium]|nr:SDR family oxidoreductase [Deltaproteobacteria bacterium]
MKNRVIVVTGAASGIGAAICRRFGTEKAKIVMLDMDEAALNEQAEALRDKGQEAFPIFCDVAREESCARAMEDTIRRHGGIDVLVNCAGTTLRAPFTDCTVSVLRKVMDVNFFGYVNCTKAALPSLMERKGSIVVISSIAGFAPLLGRTGYCASKHALHGFFNTLRAELKNTGVHVLIVCPGFTKTNLQSRALAGDGGRAQDPRTQYGKESSPDTVAEAVYIGVLERKRLLVLTAVGKITHLLFTLSPALYDWMMIRNLGKSKEDL